MTKLLAGLRRAVARFLALTKHWALAKYWPGAKPLVGEPAPHPWEQAYPPGLSWHLEVEPEPLFDFFDRSVSQFADRPCLHFLGKAYSYRTTGELVAKAAKGFQDLGVRKGVRVGLFLPNSHYFVICYFAILKAGGTVVNFNPLYAEREVARQIRDSDLRFMVTLDLANLYSKIAGRLDDSQMEKIILCSMSGALPMLKNAFFAFFRRKEIVKTPDDQQHVKFDRLIDNDGDYRPVAIDPHQDIAVLQYTGGTTGIPKGAMLTHAGLYTNMIQTSLWASEIKSGEEKILAVLPLFHVFAMTAVMNAGLYRGAELVLVPRFRVGELLKIIDKMRPTVFFGVPTIYSSINGYKHHEKYDLSSLKFCVSGGAPLPLEIQTTFERLTGCTLVEGYGLTEASPTCTINPITGSGKPGSAGQPIPGTLVEILSLENPDKTLPLGEIGEVAITGPQVMAGYWKHEQETAMVLQDGRLRTGDVGYLDEEGFLFLIDRIKDLIITGGYNVYPRMVEEALFLHPAVEEAAVCGIPDRHHGEMVKAYIKLRAGTTLSGTELRRFLKDKLAPFELPRRIEFRDEIPKTLVGKPLRRELIAEELERQRKEAAQPPKKPGAPSPTEQQPEQKKKRVVNAA